MIKKFSILLFLVFLTGCGCRIIDWGRKTFNQGCKYDLCEKIPQEYIRSIRVYDQFSTLGIFNAMWLTNEVQKIFMQVYAHKNWLTQEEAQEIYTKKCQENENFISFYMLAYTPRSEYPLGNSRRGESWTITLKVGDQTYLPHRVQKIELVPEFKAFFGKFFSRFKTSYLVQFYSKDENGNNIIQPGEKYLILCLASMKAKTALSWELDSKARMIKNSAPDSYCLHDNIDCCVCKTENVKLSCNEGI